MKEQIKIIASAVNSLITKTNMICKEFRNFDIFCSFICIYTGILPFFYYSYYIPFLFYPSLHPHMIRNVV